MATTLVTGAAGFAGSHLLDLLARESGSGDTLVAWHRGNGDEETRSLDGRVGWETVDVLDREKVMTAVARLRPSMIYHCAGEAHVGRAWDRTEMTFATNVRGTANLLDGLASANVEARVLIPSSALVYASADRPLREEDALVPSSPYGLSKLAQERLARHSGPGLTVTIARAFNHIGPRQSPQFSASGFARRIAEIERGEGPPTIAVGNLDARRDLTDVRDTVRAYREILQRASHMDAFNVCSGRAISIREMLDKLVARARVPVRVEIDRTRYRPNDTPLLVGDGTRIRTRLGWAPMISIDDTLDDVLQYWRSEK